MYCINKYPKDKLRFIFADTNWEHEETYKYLEYLELLLDIEIVRLKSTKYKGMEDLCIKKGLFPTRLKKFCTIELKIIPILEYYEKLKNQGFKVISVVGVRQDESEKRKPEQLWKTNFIKTPQFNQWNNLKNTNKSKAVKNYYSKENTITVYQPIVYWTTQQVYDYVKSNNVELNPLYKKGLSRVGCYPCINANKTEIGLLDDTAIKKVHNLENKINENYPNKNATFFYKGTKGIHILALVEKYKINSLGLDLGCMNQYGLCE